MKDELTLEEYFFLQYHLGMKINDIDRLSEQDRKLMVELFIRSKNV